MLKLKTCTFQELFLPAYIQCIFHFFHGVMSPYLHTLKWSFRLKPAQYDE